MGVINFKGGSIQFKGGSIQFKYDNKLTKPTINNVSYSGGQIHYDVMNTDPITTVDIYCGAAVFPATPKLTKQGLNVAPGSNTGSQINQTISGTNITIVAEARATDKTASDQDTYNYANF